MTRATRLFLAAICGRGDAYACNACCHKRVIDSHFYRAELETDMSLTVRAERSIMRRERRPMFPAIACNLEIRRLCITHASGSTVGLFAPRVIIAVVVASREDPHPITGIVPASTSHRSIVLNAASSCNDDDDEVDAHSRHSTYLDRRTHCLQLHVSYSASNPMRSIIYLRIFSELKF